jgi:formylglycine-generating enzyme required for sulfatase activity/tetratricopeptide (TPR) repeat protein
VAASGDLEIQERALMSTPSHPHEDSFDSPRDAPESSRDQPENDQELRREPDPFQDPEPIGSLNPELPETADHDPNALPAAPLGGQSPGPTGAIADAGAPVLPSFIGRYRVLGLLGRGSFGRVFLAYDDALKRSLAIKVPNPDRIMRPQDIEAYLNEARVLAKLDHPRIVPVYDVGRTDDGLCYIVSKYVEGSSLAARIRQGRPPFHESAELVAVVADALHHAHGQRFVHRDIKPANILLDRDGKPCVADFGLALTSEGFGKGRSLVGTPSYMSPEQARGEGHRVDGRSDIFSLGIVFYELLTGRRPFEAPSNRELRALIAGTEAVPPRQIDDTIPRELERINLKALARKASERYTAACDLAEDLRHYLKDANRAHALAMTDTAIGSQPAVTQPVTPQLGNPPVTDSDLRPVTVIPRGLRAFDEHDAGFFLELVPGPRDREGLPDSLRFWKDRIEEPDADRTFEVGLVHGPSGCGKSSLIRAGLRPRLAKSVLVVFIEATPEATETRLLRSLRNACAQLPPDAGLAESLMSIRGSRVLGPGQKVLIVLDQFEQWLHARRGEENPELVSALRQCDREHLQALILVRDDFWTSAAAFMRDLEVALIEGHNMAAVDRFDLRHTRKVLSAFGQAHGSLPGRVDDFTRDQNAFLDQAVQGLAQDGKVIPVRLALFVETMKGRPWTAAGLRSVGGTEGVRVTFLEETFSSPQANPRHRLHQKAARAVLKALMPETGSEIKGRLRSEDELRDASGAAGRGSEFTELVYILDGELRLITPTDPTGSIEDSPAISPGRRCYQLTHDYLVHSLREWLTRKQKETRRGRAELRLAEHSGVWSAKPERRYLPSLVEWVNLRLLTRKREWTPPQRLMMQRAGRLHGIRSLTLAVVTALLALGAYELWGAHQASNLVEKLKTASTTVVPGIIQSLGRYRRWADPQLRSLVRGADDTSREKLHASLALLPVDPKQLPFLEGKLLDATPDRLPGLVDALRSHRSTMVGHLWAALDTAPPGAASLLPAAGALAAYEPSSSRWPSVGGKLAQALVRVNPVDLGPWLEALRPAGRQLIAPLVEIYRDKSRPDDEHILATRILASYLGDDQATLVADLLMDAEPKAYTILFPLAQRLADRTAPVFEEVMKTELPWDWHETSLDPSWMEPTAALQSRIASADGLLKERFAFCQTMPIDEFGTVAEELWVSGYRPIRFRPYNDGRAVRVAAVWTRDGRRYRMVPELSSEELSRRDEINRGERFIPVDVAGYLVPGDDGNQRDRYGALWVERSGDDDARLYAGVTADARPKMEKGLGAARLVQGTFQVLRLPNQTERFSAVWGRARVADTTISKVDDLTERDFRKIQADRGDRLLLDLSVGAASQPPSRQDVYKAGLGMAARTLKDKPNDVQARFRRASANVWLNKLQAALDDLNLLTSEPEFSITARFYRAIVLARLGKKDEALEDMKSIEKVDIPTRFKLQLAAILAAELGEVADVDRAFAALDEALSKAPQDADLRLPAARAYALASRAAPIAPARGRELADRAFRLLGEEVQSGHADFERLRDDPDLDPLRDDPRFLALLKPGHLEHSFAGVWSDHVRFEAIPVYGFDPIEHLSRCRALESQGCRPFAVSVFRAAADDPPLTASVWYRPVIREADWDQLAERQARAAVALIRLGRADRIWLKLIHSRDPRLRSFIVNWLDPMGTETGVIVTQFGRVDSDARPVPAQGTPSTDAILFHPETSMRRALILALGTYAADRFSPDEKERLTRRLLQLYRDDPDSGIHGAAGWALRQWQQGEGLKGVDGELKKLNDKDRGERRWYVNGQGQTYTVIDGPVTYRMGSPPDDPDRSPGEAPRTVEIPRRFAIAAREVTVEQYQQFAPPRAPYSVAFDLLRNYSPDPGGPITGVSWFMATAYCNWLSEREGVPRDQWCYEIPDGGTHTDGMTIPANALHRTGYRLPTVAEWEYACRSGTTTSRYYGQSTDLLRAYAWYQAHGGEHARPVATLKPNDLGLFDMLGNAYEWCQDPVGLEWPAKQDHWLDDRTGEELIERGTSRVTRGGAFFFPAHRARAAPAFNTAPSNVNLHSGFRPARTLH